jgi:hypothetical protein
MPGDLTLETIVAASAEQVSCALGEESAILNLTNSVYYGLNAVGTSVWNLLQKPHSVRELRDAIVEEYAVEPATCENELLDLLEKMRSQGLMQVLTTKGC